MQRFLRRTVDFYALSTAIPLGNSAGRFTTRQHVTRLVTRHPHLPQQVYYTASAELRCFRNTRSIFRGDDVFRLVFFILSLLAVLRLLDVEGGPLFGTPFSLGIVEYLLSLDMLWRLVSSALETLNFLFRYLNKYIAKRNRMMVNTQPATAAPITWPTSSFDPSLVSGARCIFTPKNKFTSEFDWLKNLVNGIFLIRVTIHQVTKCLHQNRMLNNIPENLVSEIFESRKLTTAGQRFWEVSTFWKAYTCVFSFTIYSSGKPRQIFSLKFVQRSFARRISLL